MIIIITAKIIELLNDLCYDRAIKSVETIIGLINRRTQLSGGRYMLFIT
jgi:hypothetical protein